MKSSRAPKSLSVEPTFGYLFPAIRGVQAGREYFVSMCPLRLLPKLFQFDNEELPPEVRAQRIVNKNRIPEIARYMSENKKDYVFSSLTASIDGDVKFQSFGSTGGGVDDRIGILQIPIDAKFIINDGQHRRAAIENTLRDHPELGSESISVVLFLDRGLERCQQMFADLNRHAIRPSQSLGILYDHRDDRAKLTKLVVLKCPTFAGLVETEKSSLAARSRRLFTLSAIYQANAALLTDIQPKSLEAAADIAINFWEAVGKAIPEWGLVQTNKITAGEVREDFIHTHGVVLHAIAIVGNILLRDFPKNWKDKIKQLNTLNWSRNNAKLWEGRAMIGGRVSKASHNVTLTTNVLKKHLELPLTPEDEKVERAFKRGEYGKQ